jgi:chromosome segregation ATPase
VKSRVLPILNAIGCLVLTALVASQWLKERKSDQVLIATQSELSAAKEFSASETQRATALERDIAVLKESIEATQKSAEQAARAAAEKTTAAIALETEVTAARGQVKTWETALAERDAKLRSLDAELIATRKRLDAAIAELKSAVER